jgi:DNA mismatch repair protein MutL
VLEKHVAELIAAGEVVERPASVVKELVENAIDASATDITVEILNGGVRMMRVSDNGTGITREDIPKAFLRHATSKVCKAEDLDSILTLGFRGEALASVAAMCKVELLTKTANALEATLYRIEGGVFLGMEAAARPTGTTITVSDIFYNTPARMKFLKKDVAEGHAVAQVVDRCALSHPEIAFTFIRDGAKKLKTSGNSDMLAVIYAIYGREFAAEMQKVDYRFEDFATVTGYISKPGAAKPSRSYQSFFINGRFVRTRTGSAALEEAYKNKIMHGRFPACFLNLELDARTLDVNVHPAKIEVRFVNERPVFSAVYYAVKSALQQLETGFSGVREYVPAQNKPAIDEYMSLAQKAATLAPAINRATPVLNSARIDIFTDEPKEENSSFKTDSAKIIPEEQFKLNNATNPAQNATIAVGAEWRVIGELFKTYILVEAGDKLVLVDKHAVHERILYEKLKASISAGDRQTLLAPVTVSLPREEHAAMLENPEKLEALGFLAEDFGGGAVIVREVPLELSEKDIAMTIREIADKLKNHAHDLTPNVLDRLHYSIACRSALKAGDLNSPEELAEIIRRLEENPEITHCPHGRPVSVRITRREIEKMFGRLG